MEDLKKFRELVKKLEEHLGEKATFQKYDEETQGFNTAPWSENQNEIYNVYVAGYSVHSVGKMILKHDMHKTESDQVLKFGEGFYGFSHRAGCTFEKGDMLFEEGFKVTKDHPKWVEYETKHKENLIEDPQCYGKFEEHVMDYVNFKERGSKVIETSEECYAAALNFAKHVS